MNKHNHLQQRLFWSISRPLKYMGLTVDEMLVTLTGIGLAIYFLMDERLSISMFLFVGTFTMCWFLKKWKRLSTNFKLKSFLVSKNILPAPKSHPKMLNKERVGK